MKALTEETKMTKNKHKHEWQLIQEAYFLCHCGGYKVVKPFEVKDDKE